MWNNKREQHRVRRKEEQHFPVLKSRLGKVNTVNPLSSPLLQVLLRRREHTTGIYRRSRLEREREEKVFFSLLPIFFFSSSSPRLFKRTFFSFSQLAHHLLLLFLLLLLLLLLLFLFLAGKKYAVRLRTHKLSVRWRVCWRRKEAGAKEMVAVTPASEVASTLLLLNE